MRAERVFRRTAPGYGRQSKVRGCKGEQIGDVMNGINRDREATAHDSPNSFQPENDRREEQRDREPLEDPLGRLRFAVRVLDHGPRYDSRP